REQDVTARPALGRHPQEIVGPDHIRVGGEDLELRVEFLGAGVPERVVPRLAAAVADAVVVEHDNPAPACRTARETAQQGRAHEGGRAFAPTRAHPRPPRPPWSAAPGLRWTLPGIAD